MKFEGVRLKGEFRDYQKRVLDNMDKYLENGKINIVAAPGSGKTVLGLEMIRRIGEPCLILSPTTAIREQWGERFRDLYLDEKADFVKLFSRDIHDVKLVNSITYQALYTAVEKTDNCSCDDIDSSDVDIFALMREKGIGTICLDEAHHLKNEWQRALEKFVFALEKDVKIISLTATPPYDSEGNEWNRYVAICGEIDEEIFVPELVGQNTLCPHQDYVYFNYPTKEEIESFKTHKINSMKAVDSIGKMDFLKGLCQTLNNEKNYELFFDAVKEHVALLTLFQYYGFEINKKLIRELTAKKGLPKFKIKYAETALQFLLGGDLILEENKEEIIRILKQEQMYDKKKVTLDLNEKQKRSLISSVGKLESIKSIVRSESAAMGERLRLLILTDYIKKENVSKIASAEEFNSVNVVSIFETLRRDNKAQKLGVLSGTLVILPKAVKIEDFRHMSQDIPNTDYCTVSFSGGTHNMVECVGKLLEKGEINVLIGTKSLLGEGWDSPCVNTLILASFVGSFVLSNQMRGRAIRIDKNDPEKCANIWHLVTVEPEYIFKEKLNERVSEYINQDKNELNSYDFEILKKRFDSFMGPNYRKGEIESGIERISAITPPYDRNGIERINDEMLYLSRNRKEIAGKWQGHVADGKFNVAVETEIDKEKHIPIFNFWNFGLSAILAGAEIGLLQAIIRGIMSGIELKNLWLVAFVISIGLVLFHLNKNAVIHSNPVHSMKTLGRVVYNTLCECGIISSSAKVEIKSEKGARYLSMYLRNATVHDQNIFNTAMTEMLSPIENPRYIIIKKNIFGKYEYEVSFACPTIIAKKKEYANILAENLRNSTGNFDAVYTHCEQGRSFILKCRKKSYITFNEKAMGKKMKVSHWE